jgi:hypothetical protein
VMCRGWRGDGHGTPWQSPESDNRAKCDPRCRGIRGDRRLADSDQFKHTLDQQSRPRFDPLSSVDID